MTRLIVCSCALLCLTVPNASAQVRHPALFQAAQLQQQRALQMQMAVKQLTYVQPRPGGVQYFPRPIALAPKGPIAMANPQVRTTSIPAAITTTRVTLVPGQTYGTIKLPAKLDTLPANSFAAGVARVPAVDKTVTYSITKNVTPNPGTASAAPANGATSNSKTGAAKQSTTVPSTSSGGGGGYSYYIYY